MPYKPKKRPIRDSVEKPSLFKPPVQNSGRSVNKPDVFSLNKPSIIPPKPQPPEGR